MIDIRDLLCCSVNWMEVCATSDGSGVVYAVGNRIKPQEKTRVGRAERPAGGRARASLERTRNGNLDSCAGSDFVVMTYPRFFLRFDRFPNRIYNARAVTGVTKLHPVHRTASEIYIYIYSYRQDMPESLHGPDRQTLRKCPVGAITYLLITRFVLQGRDARRASRTPRGFDSERIEKQLRTYPDPNH